MGLGLKRTHLFEGQQSDWRQLRAIADVSALWLERCERASVSQEGLVKSEAAGEAVGTLG